MIAVTFDFGQTLAELDHEMLARRVSERGARLDAARARVESDAAWQAYGEAKRRGLSGHDAWCTFMSTLLRRAGLSPMQRPPAERPSDPADSALIEEVTQWLWTEQPRENLWRKPVAGMFELVADLAAAGITLGIISNSEGKIAELVRELGIAEHFDVIADSGVIGIEKPDPRIFQFAAERLGVPTEALIHVGDAWEADVVGALGVGARAVWFAPTEERELPEGVHRARNAAELALVLEATCSKLRPGRYSPA